MQLALKALLVLGLAVLMHAKRRSQEVSMKLGQGTRQKGRTFRLVLDPAVTPQIVSVSTPALANMSLSPWTYRKSCNESRVPRQISHAQCLTTGCLSLQGGGEDALEAKPIYYQVLVLYRVPAQRPNNKGGKKKRKKKYEFHLGTEVISVGCTCVRPTVVPM